MPSQWRLNEFYKLNKKISDEDPSQPQSFESFPQSTYLSNYCNIFFHLHFLLLKVLHMSHFLPIDLFPELPETDFV